MIFLFFVKDVSKYYGNWIGCVNVGFDFYSGEVMGIVGEFGFGKLILLNCFVGYYVLDIGEVIFDICIDGLCDIL